jgi:hypothetical protein
MPTVKATNKSVKKTVKKSRVSKRTVSERPKSRSVVRKHASPSPTRMKKYQEAFNAALKKVSTTKKPILKSVKKPSKSVKVVKFSKSPVKPSRGNSTYQLFVKDYMTRPEMRDKTGPERMKKAAEAWRSSQK